RQLINDANGTLIVRELDRKHDRGNYECHAFLVAGASSANSDAATGASNVVVASTSSASVGHQSLSAVAVGGTAATTTALGTWTINVQVVVGPKIDPFDFSRHLEDGMRAVAVCAVIFGDSPIEITWFKDGQLLTSELDQELSVDVSSGFVSTLTFHRVRPAHSGLYTCVAANSFATATHSARMLVNVAPYFLETPRDSSVLLGRTLVMNCRAGGQPTPQVRWKKLVRTVQQQHEPQATSTSTTTGVVTSTNMNMNSNNNNQVQQQHVETFKTITSNPHVQVYENGSMVIRALELSDAGRYACQAHNDVAPGASALVSLSVLSPAHFDTSTKFETLSVRRGARIQLTCSPRGDPPLQVRWTRWPSHLQSQSQSQSSLTTSLTPPPLLSISNVEANNNVVAFTNADMISQPMLISSSASSTGSGSRYRINEWSSQQQQQGQQQQQQQQQQLATLTSELTIEALERADSAHYTCNASNVHGSDQLTYRVLVQEPPEPPTNVRVLAIGSNVVRLAWHAPRHDGNSPLTAYVLEYRTQVAAGGQPGAQSARQDWTRITVQVGASRQVISSASASSIAEAGAATAGSAHSTTVNSNLEHSLAPMDLAAMTNAHMADSSMIPVKFHGPPIVEQQDSGTSAMAGTAVVAGQQQQQQEVLVRRLAARTTYECRVASVNALGQGDWATPYVTLTTAEEAPAYRPTEVRAHALSTTTLRVQWRGPQHQEPSAPIKGYYIGYRKLPGASTSTSTNGAVSVSGQSFELNNDTSTVAAFATIETHNNNNNNRNTNYNNQANANNAVMAAQLRNTNNVAATNNNNELAKQLTATYNEQQQAHEYIIHNLERNTRYEIKLQAYNNAGTGPPVETHAQTLKFDRPAAPLVRVMGAHSSSIEIRWQQPSSSNINTNNEQAQAPIAGYSIFYKCEYDEWQELQLQANIQAYVLDNLRCGTKYQIYVSAFNAAGRSDPSDVLLARTDGSAPVAPDKSQLIRVNITQAIIDLGAWQSGGCPIQNFMIQYKKGDDSNWFVVSDGSPTSSVQKQQQHQLITIADLQPATWYKLLMSVANEAGTTNAEYMFGTLTPDGAAIPLPANMAHQFGAGQHNNNHHIDQHSINNNKPGMTDLVHWLLFELNFLIPLGVVLLLALVVGALFVHLSSSSANIVTSSSCSIDDSTEPHNQQQTQQQQQQSAALRKATGGHKFGSQSCAGLLQVNNVSPASNSLFGAHLHHHLLRVGATPSGVGGANHGTHTTHASSSLATQSTACLVDAANNCSSNFNSASSSGASSSSNSNNSNSNCNFNSNRLNSNSCDLTNGTFEQHPHSSMANVAVLLRNNNNSIYDGTLGNNNYGTLGAAAAVAAGGEGVGVVTGGGGATAPDFIGNSAINLHTFTATSDDTTDDNYGHHSSMVVAPIEPSAMDTSCHAHLTTNTCDDQTTGSSADATFAHQVYGGERAALHLPSPYATSQVLAPAGVARVASTMDLSALQSAMSSPDWQHALQTELQQQSSPYQRLNNLSGAATVYLHNSNTNTHNINTHSYTNTIGATNHHNHSQMAARQVNQQQQHQQHQRAHTLHRDTGFANVRLICHTPTLGHTPHNKASMHSHQVTINNAANGANNDTSNEHTQHSFVACDFDGYSRVSKRA
ncbi:Down syndrome cell adhesion molecule-like protein Dscam2, partial [Fragariocoptes setiger]